MALRFHDADLRLVLGVHDLVDAGPQRGDLRMVASSVARMQAGQRVHTEYQAQRAEADTRFRAEVPVKVEFACRGWTVRVQGRLDGLTERDGVAVIEEVKSTGLPGHVLAGRIGADWPHYEAQVAVYRWLLHAMGHRDPVGELVMVSLVDGARRTFVVDEPLEETHAWIMERLDWVLRQREKRNAWMLKRRSHAVPFPHDSLRDGQQAVVDSVAGALSRGKTLLLSAPTGTGKTAAALQAILTSAYARDKKVFVATAKGTQQAIVEKTLAAFAKRGLPLRAVSIRAKEKACLNQVVDCRPESCNYAARYYDKVEAAMEALLPQGVLRPRDLRQVGMDDGLCPFELSLDLSDHADVVVGDYNYVFHPQVTLRRHFGDRPQDWIVLVDEAHNLPERARSYWSPALAASDADDAAQVLEHEEPELLSAFIRLARDVEQAILDVRYQVEPGGWTARGEALVDLSPRLWKNLADRVGELSVDYALYRRERPAPDKNDPYLDLSRAVLHFSQVLSEWQQHGAGREIASLFVHKPTPSVKLACLDPSPWMARRFAALGGAVLMSATLSPPRFYRDLLGLADDKTEEQAHPSPFPPENLGVFIAPRVSTSFRDRSAHAERTAALITRIAQATPGNTAVFYSSFGLLRGIEPHVDTPQREVLVQAPRMDDLARQALVDRLRGFGAPRVLHAVLGGIFSEGIDLPGGILKTAILVGPGLPGIGLERDLMRSWYQERYGDGFGYAFLVPGLSKVVQAAGRVVRGPDDVGCVVLVGRRFGWRDYQAFFPAWWTPTRSDTPGDDVAAFWQAQS